ncbi:cupin domain-containing protein [Thermogymnomonas acidicola]|uniref:cupin domain-containing protein n=1 Tax=Thermogymnomonas acidicola TaxID=399579 RepID=UPI0009465425|nr:cupin domain-containing protein [Thermogymnomonas acidicola]
MEQGSVVYEPVSDGQLGIDQAIIFRSERVTVKMLRFSGGDGHYPPMHRHVGKREVITVLEGSIYAVIDGEGKLLREGETEVVEENTRHMLSSKGGAAKVLLTISETR